MPHPELGGHPTEIRPGRPVHLAAASRGVATSIFFLHGGGGNKEQFRFLWSALRTHNVNLVAWDAPGHGASPDLPRVADYTGTALVEDALAVIRAHGTARNIIVAHSLGTRVTLGVLLAAPGLVESALLLGPPPPQRLAPARSLSGAVLGHLPRPLLSLFRPLLGRRFRKLAWSPAADRKLIATERRATKRNKLWVMQALLAGGLGFDPAALAAIRVPVRILAGADDGLTPPAAAPALARALPDAELAILPQCGHQIMLEQPAATLDALRPLLGGV